MRKTISEALEKWQKCRLERVIALGFGKRLMFVKELAKGTRNSVKVDANKAIALLKRHDAKGLVIAHNHPSGRMEPSEKDWVFKGVFEEACSRAGFRLVDSVIFGKGGFLSMSEEEEKEMESNNKLLPFVRSCMSKSEWEAVWAWLSQRSAYPMRSLIGALKGVNRNLESITTKEVRQALLGKGGKEE